MDVSQETLACATGFARGDAVNLEKALRLSDRLGGHLVSGHVDGRGVVERIEEAGDNRVLEISIPRELARYVARKGSVALDGVSLTVNAVDGARFDVNLIPHTLVHTNFGRLQPGVQVNVEIDFTARYAERMWPSRTATGRLELGAQSSARAPAMDARHRARHTPSWGH